MLPIYLKNSGLSYRYRWVVQTLLFFAFNALGVIDHSEGGSNYEIIWHLFVSGI